MIKFSIASLLLAVLVAAVACAALINANEIWSQAAVSATMLVLLVATLIAIQKEGRKRVSAQGFALFGWAYLLIAFVPALRLHDDLISNRAIRSLYGAMHQERDAILPLTTFSADGRRIVGRSADGTFRVWDLTGQDVTAAVGRIPGSPQVRASYGDFSNIGHAVCALILACVGAVCALVLSPRKEPALESPGID